MKFVSEWNALDLISFLFTCLAASVFLGLIWLTISYILNQSVILNTISTLMEQAELQRESVVYYGELPSDFCDSDAAHQVPSELVPDSFWGSISADYVLSYFNEGKLIKVFYKIDADNRIIATNRIELWCVQ